MRTIKIKNSFKRDRKKLQSNHRYAKILKQTLPKIIDLLADDEPLPLRFRDHGLTGNWEGFRECHLAFDLLFIYKQTEDGALLELTRLGSHSQVFG